MRRQEEFQNAGWGELQYAVQQALANAQIGLQGRRMKFGESLSKKDTVPFSDVPANHWLENELQLMFDSGERKRVLLAHTVRRDKVEKDDVIYRDLRFSEEQICIYWPSDVDDNYLPFGEGLHMLLKMPGDGFDKHWRQGASDEKYKMFGVLAAPGAHSGDRPKVAIPASHWVENTAKPVDENRWNSDPDTNYTNGDQYEGLEFEKAPFEAYVAELKKALGVA